MYRGRNSLSSVLFFTAAMSASVFICSFQCIDLKYGEMVRQAGDTVGFGFGSWTGCEQQDAGREANYMS